ncbi:SURF1 family protein [Glycomyces algeriensis]|jgi:cytochrome oxidase assembly protein ShyY1|uniref:SURF1-like protein n=1 Tax=Glycomyces algeriensis TaxID=256037 RepID=A0A9W6G7X8_9ACTN|nr:SURF1 family protein [Glycomyces algeriensis]MDA1365999.1 SURF1 family protein [Glycomyces algeriensis]GLI41934.1 SURF1-like protein [Glycomyces algeriensis]
MQRYRFVLAPRWLLLTLAGLVVMVVCVLLSQWQWGRAVERAAANDVIEHSREAAPLDATLPPGEGLDDDVRWTLVEATGVYDTENEIVLRAQTNNSLNGFEIVTPLVLADGTAILVDRGFVASENTGSVPDYPAAPAGEVTVTGRVYEYEESSGAVSEADGHLESRRLSIDMLGPHLDYELRSAWIADIEPAEGFTALETPSFKDWQNYSYAVQWALFAAMVPVGWVVLARRERRDMDDEGAAENGEAAPGEEPEAAATSEAVNPRT